MENLINVFQGTLEDTKRGYYENSFGEEIEFEGASSFYYTKVPRKETSFRGDKKTKIYAQNIDSFVKAIEMGEDAAVLNMASDYMPGGGVEKGSRAQEEDLFRRSNLAQTLYKYHPQKARKMGFRHNPKYAYPLKTYEAIFSQNVSIYKKPSTYAPYYEPYLTNVITMAALKRPELTEDGSLKESDAEIMKEKIRCVFRVALDHNITKLVLGAWGCGSYGLPAKDMARLFKEILNETNFKFKFDEICFAIIEDKNSMRNGEGNFKSFANTFNIL